MEKFLSECSLDAILDTYPQYESVQGRPQLTMGLPYRASQRLRIATDIWERQHHRLSKFLTLDESTFANRKENLLSCLDDAVLEFKRTDFSGFVRSVYEYERLNPVQSTRDTHQKLLEYALRRRESTQE